MRILLSCNAEMPTTPRLKVRRYTSTPSPILHAKTVQVQLPKEMQNADHSCIRRRVLGADDSLLDRICDTVGPDINIEFNACNRSGKPEFRISSALVSELLRPTHLIKRIVVNVLGFDASIESESPSPEGKEGAQAPLHEARRFPQRPTN